MAVRVSFAAFIKSVPRVPRALAPDALEQARQASFRDFWLEICPPFVLSAVAMQALSITSERELAAELTKKPNHRSNVMSVRQQSKPEYDIVHFQSSGISYERHVLHHNMAFALAKITNAQQAIRGQGYNIVYAVPDAQLVLLMEHLRQPRPSLEVHYRQKDVHDDENGSFQFDDRLYVRTISDQAATLAYESLTGPCAIFQVCKDVEVNQGVKAPKSFMAFAFFEDIAVDGNLRSKLEVKYQDLGYIDECVVVPQGLIRGCDSTATKET